MRIKQNLVKISLVAAIFAGGILTDRLIQTVNATGWDGLVYSVNNVSGDSAGNVDVEQVNGKSVNKDISNTVDFTQYEQNTTSLSTINNVLSNLSATAADIEEGKSAVVSGGVKQDGLNRGLWTRYDINENGLLDDMTIIQDYQLESLTFDVVKPRFDLNSDGNVDDADITILSDVLQNYSGLADQDGVTGYDIDGDGIINNDDLVALQDMALGGTYAKIQQYLAAPGKLFDVDASGSISVSDVIALRDIQNAEKSRRELSLGITSRCDAEPWYVIEGQKLYGKYGFTTGTMPNNEAVSETVGIGGTYTIPAGYHNGSGTVSGPVLSGADATASQILNGYKAFDNSGTLLTGTYSPSITVLQTYTETKVGIDQYCTWDVTKTAPAGTTHVYLHYVKYGGSGGWLHWYRNGTEFSPGNNVLLACTANTTIRYYSRTMGTDGGSNRYADTYLIAFLKLS